MQLVLATKFVKISSLKNYYLLFCESDIIMKPYLDLVGLWQIDKVIENKQSNFMFMLIEYSYSLVPPYLVIINSIRKPLTTYNGFYYL